MPAKIPKKIAARIAKQLPSFQKVLTAAKDRDVNESDTVTIVTDILAEVFGYDKYTDITSEQAIRGTYCDLAIRLDGAISFLIEVKAIGLDLKDNHLRQAVNYGANHGIKWIVLTNGVHWTIHCLTFERPINHEMVCEFNLLEMNPRKDSDQEKLYLLCKEGIVKEAIQSYQDHIQSVNRFIVGALIQSETVVHLLRREVRRVSPSVRVSLQEIQDLLPEVLKRDVLEGPAAQNARARVKRSSSRALKKRQSSRPSAQGPAAV